MWCLLAVLYLFNCALARPTSTVSASCLRDELFSSLYQDGVDFCESVMDNHCATVSTPAPYTSFESSEISSYCECVLTEIQSTRTDATGGSGFGLPTETSEYQTPGLSNTSTSQASAGSGSVSESPTTTSMGSQTESGDSEASSSRLTDVTSASRGSVANSTTESVSDVSASTSLGRSTESVEGTALPLTSRASSDSTPTQGSRNGTASTGSLTGGTLTRTGLASTQTAAVNSSATSSATSRTVEASSGTALPTGSGAGGTWNSTATSGQVTSNMGSQTAPESPMTILPVSDLLPSSGSPPTGGARSGNSTSAAGQTKNGTVNAPLPTSLSTFDIPSGSGELPPLPTTERGPWNTTVVPGQTVNGTAPPPVPTGSQEANETNTAGSSSFPVSLITGSPVPVPASSSIFRSTGVGLSVPWNATASGLGPSGSVGRGTVGISSTRSLSATLLPSNSSGSILSQPTASQSSNVTESAGAGSQTLVPPGRPSPSSSFIGWNGTASTEAGQVTGRPNTIIPTGTGTRKLTVSPTLDHAATGRPNQTATVDTGSSSPNATQNTGTLLPTSRGASNSSLGVPSASGVVNSTAVLTTSLPMTIGTIEGSSSASTNFTFFSRTPSSSYGPTPTSDGSTANDTRTGTATPTVVSATSSGNGSSPPLPTIFFDPVPSGTQIPAANFTEFFRNAAVAEETCYSLPPDGNITRRALVRNSKLRESNVSIPAPYIESVEFDSEGLQPLFLTVRDAEQGKYFLDISNKSRLAIADDSGASMVLDDGGVQFATNSCRYDVNVAISDMFAQLADLSQIDCSFGNSSTPPPPPVKRAEDIQFNQTLYLGDQCGSPVSRSIRDYPELRIGDTECIDVTVDEDSGRWDFDCTYPGSLSGTLRCQNTVKEDIMDFLVKDAFGGDCPGISAMVSTLANTSSDVLNGESFQRDLLSRNSAATEDGNIDAVVEAYEDLWSALQEIFIPAEGNAATPLEIFFTAYNDIRSFEDDICENLHAEEIPLSLNLRAGATYIEAITTLNWAPKSAEPYKITIQNPESRACCPTSFVASGQGEEACAYPNDAFVGETGCICGETTSGEAIAYEGVECSKSEGPCDSDDDCSSENSVCLTGTCCGGGICVDPYACSQNGTALVTFDLEGALR